MAYKQIPRSPVEKPGDRIKALIAKWKAKKEGGHVRGRSTNLDKKLEGLTTDQVNELLYGEQKGSVTPKDISGAKKLGGPEDVELDPWIPTEEPLKPLETSTEDNRKYRKWRRKNQSRKIVPKI